MPAPFPVAPDATARRLEWRFLPPEVRALIEQRCGAPVVEAESRDSGFTPGFASVLTCADGRRHFVKAASVKAQRMFAESYREEAAKLAALPQGVPAPRLRWLVDDEWVVLETAYVDGEHPDRPWRPDQLDRCLDTLEELATTLTPPPMPLRDFTDEFADVPARWTGVLERRDLPHGEEAAALAAGFAEVTAGDTLVHTDVRADNVLFDRDGAPWLLDWNWPVRGAAWLDSLFLLTSPRGDGVDVERVLRERPLLRDVPAEAVDRVVALLVGYFLGAGDQPVPASSPYLRQFQRWQGEATWEWLCERRGWS